jgi:5'-nucleotidase
MEQEWMETLSTIDFEDLNYESFVECGTRLAKRLRHEEVNIQKLQSHHIFFFINLKNNQKVDYVIALTHMRLPNDIILAEDVPEIDLILGGHDHNYICELINATWVIKSGTDFRDLSLIEMGIKEHPSDTAIVTQIEHYKIDSKVEENEDLAALVKFYTGERFYEYNKKKLSSFIWIRFLNLRSN